MWIKGRTYLARMWKQETKEHLGDENKDGQVSATYQASTMRLGGM